ncbi:hypothetical protein LUZ60_010267 [Juncus effusus]|nr:hypothetical protein LUZ60_010267 [Juncus effusus]
MFNGMMDPELLKLAQEQMSRIRPEEFAKIQQQMMSNPDLVKMATESMKNMGKEDFKRAAEQMKHARPEDMAEMSERVANAKPEEIAAMKAHADAQINYELSGAKMLKQQGNELHSRGQYSEAAEKYKRAKDNLKDVPTSAGRALQMQCALNLMSCYLRIGRYNECINEGTEVLSYDSSNVKALYRRGQAYRELANFEASRADLEKANENSPDDETIANVLRDVKDKCVVKKRTVSKGVIIEEISDDEKEEEKPESSSVRQWRSPVENSGSLPVENNKARSTESTKSADLPLESERLKSLGDDPATIRMFQNYISSTDPETLSRLSNQQGMSPDMVKTASEMIKTMKPDELQKMFQLASSLNPTKTPVPTETGQMGPDMIKMASEMGQISPDMIKMASETIGKMKPDDLQRMMGSINPKTSVPPEMGQLNPDMIKMASETIGKMKPDDLQRMMSMASSSFGGNLNSGVSSSGAQPSVSVPSSSGSAESAVRSNLASTDDLQAARNSMNDPAMRQMMTDMMKSMDPETMANMSQQFGMKLSKEDAAKAQQAMASLSPNDLDRMMRWAERAQRGMETVKRTKNWLLGKQGMILAIVMLIIAFILHQLGFIGS